MFYLSIFSGFAWTGFKRSLTYDDLYDLPPFIKSCNVVPPFLRNFFVHEKNIQTESTGVKLNGATEEIKFVKSFTGSKRHGVFRTIAKTYGLYFMTAMVMKLVVDVLTFIPPLFLKKIIGYVARLEENSTSKK